jgi:hypothetical protein
MASSGITFILNFVELDQLVLKLKGGIHKRKHGDLMSVLLTLQKESRVKMKGCDTHIFYYLHPMAKRGDMSSKYETYRFMHCVTQQLWT